MNDPVKDLASVVSMAEERREFGNMLTRVRQISESHKMTLERVLEERNYVVALLDVFFKDRFQDRTNPFKDQFDYQYGRAFKGAMENVFAAAGVSLKKNG
jgi:hypothetical protein